LVITDSGDETAFATKCGRFSFYFASRTPIRYHLKLQYLSTFPLICRELIGGEIIDLLILEGQRPDISQPSEEEKSIYLFWRAKGPAQASPGRSEERAEPWVPDQTAPSPEGVMALS